MAASKTRIYVGTSGWTYDDWAGRFYPSEVKGPERLSFYADRFNSVEINATFYRIPTKAMIAAWNRRLDKKFHLVVKGSRLVTHMKKLQDCEEPLNNFMDQVLKLDTLRAVLWQLPPSLHKDLSLLSRFLEKLPRSVRHAVEFRHNSWWDKEVANILSKHDAAFVAVSHPRLPETISLTTDFLYVRFHGRGRELYKYEYSEDELSQWVSTLEPHLARRTLYAFFNNDYQANAPRNALTFRELLSKAM
jgi:uncharacterized protein YecE (DUF72 family)